MIAYITGTLDRTWGNSCLLICQDGLGYEVAVPAHTLASLPEAGKEVSFYTSLAVREDALELFGFTTFTERQYFEILVSIARVGARTALAILSQFRPEEIARLVAEDNVNALTRVSGIGRKTAQHIFLELKYKLKGDGLIPLTRAPAPRALESNTMQDVQAALVNLGYNEEECMGLVRDILNNDPTLGVSECLRAALRALGKGLS